MMLPKHVDPALLPATADRAILRHHHPGRTVLSRRQFMGGAAGVLAGASVLRPGTALAAKPRNATPKPIPGGLTFGGVTFHVLPFGPDQEPSVITDFNGFVGVADVRGTGPATNPDGSTETLLYDTDMRFMKGVYVGQDGAVHKGTFGFV
jgi:hypothetical protein